MKPTAEDTTDKALGLKFKEAREAKKLTQAQVAKSTGMTVTYYAMIERGEVNPSWNKLKKVAAVLKMKVVLELKE